nr:hypothetical protein CFP56_73960 [Quercus suber]
MSFQQEFSSWFAPAASSTPLSSVPTPSTKAPSTAKLPLPTNPPNAAILAFLRHCGCPFAEKTFLALRTTANAHRDVTFYAVSHSSPAATESWLKALPQAGSEPRNLHVIVDEQRDVYAAWGLGASGYGHVLSPSALWEVWRVGKEEGIWNRPTESGSRWQTGGWFGVDAQGTVRWGKAAESADQVPNFEEGVEIVKSVDGSVEAKL